MAQHFVMTDLPLAPVFDALPLPMLVIAANGLVQMANPAAADLLGPRLTGRHYIVALRQPDTLDAIEAVLAGARARTARYLGNDGARPTVWEVTVSPFTQGQARLATAVLQNITAIEDAGSMRRDFVANVSHELRTPLTALIGLIETLSGPARDDQTARQTFLGMMGQETQRMQALIADLLHLARVEDQERVRPTTSVDFSALVAGVCAEFAPRAAQRGMQITPQIAPAITLPGDAQQLRQVLSNLIENAIKYGRSGTPITVTLGAPAPQATLRCNGVRLEVRDQGDGIAPHHLARLTERFFRVDDHRARAVGGTGLGLAIVKHIVNRHRGRLRMHSTLGEGSCFSVILPS
jgi:two-component system phosphate regulon sensor histidine kinase PhoR